MLPRHLHRSSRKSVTVVIPTLNEAENIEPLLNQIFSDGNSSLRLEVLFVDDGSTDSTCDLISRFSESFPVRLLQRDEPTNGLAGAVIAGARATTNACVVVMDADLSHPPNTIADLVAPILEGSEDMVIGSRYAPGGRTPGWPWWRRCMSRLACLLAAPLTTVKDPLSGFFATRRNAILGCEGNAAAGFKIALELIVKGGKHLRVREIPVVFHDRLRGESKMRPRVLLIYLRRLSALLLQQVVSEMPFSGQGTVMRSRGHGSGTNLRTATTTPAAAP
ncbi:MAG: polyprenol monophosphomannose synthase [Chthoniobacterales bacterium]